MRPPSAMRATACILPLQGGNLMNNIAAGRVSWYRRGRKVRIGHRDWQVPAGTAAGDAMWLALWNCARLFSRVCPSTKLHLPCHTMCVSTANCKPLAFMLQVALDVARGLVFLHSKRIVHFGALAVPCCAVLCCACCAALCCAAPAVLRWASDGTACRTTPARMHAAPIDVCQLTHQFLSTHPVPCSSRCADMKSPNILLTR